MRMSFVFAGALLLAALVLVPRQINAQVDVRFSRRMAPGNRQRRGNVYEVAFSNDEENVLKAKQGETLESISRVLGGRSVQEVERRCVELGLRCGTNAKAPPKQSEKWRGNQKRGQ